MRSIIDPDLWVRRVDVALIGGDPIVIARRVKSLLRASRASAPLRLGLLHPAEFSGAPLGALEDPAFRRELGLLGDLSQPGILAAREAIRAEIDAMCLLLGERGAGGVLAFEMVQGLRDPERGESVLRLTREGGVTRRPGVVPSGASGRPLVPLSTGEGSSLFWRSKSLWEEGLEYMAHRLRPMMTTPPARQNFGDLVIADRCELLSGFISPPGQRSDHPCEQWFCDLVQESYAFAGAVPKTAGEALNMWRSDFGRAGKVPISSQDKENDR